MIILITYERKNFMSQSSLRHRQWRRSFISLWIGCFITALGYSMTMPFISLYIDTLGHFDNWQLNLYSGIAFSITYLSQAIVSPFWGKLADLRGRKLMCLRASGVMACTIFFVGVAQNVMTVIILRLLQGAFSGYINNATALMAGETPHQHSGQVMGNLMTANVTGTLLGPLFGGYLAGILGYRMPFFITGILMVVTFLLTAFAVKEHFTPIPAKKMKPIGQIFSQLDNRHLIFVMFLTTLLVQSSLMSISPIISLFVRQLMHGQGNVSLISGVVAAMPGFGTLLVASRVGHLMDRIGPQRVLFSGLVISALVFIPMYFVTTPLQLGILRFLLGLASAAMLPAVQTVLTVDVPQEAFGRIFSYNQSAQAVGGVAGPLLGSVVSSLDSYQAVFLVTAGLLIINLVMLLSARKKVD
ncbi:multidrug efflux MFS transporter [Liquorilactobacillus nagelii DSM 13675]|uniref:Multidrug transporter subunit MdtG n=3 Tax=Liquorilactobacillus nagelii TaxID=82688 RepID=A0A3S6R375_9LACO|nr:MFS transporter [Liquorilactobacillus nagelii]AUJ33177.1 multidrug transporter subunit MdtG [Liquorilactobacillus nagelii]MCP9314179.1 MFS transporter [Liquorilactobacillus nagelii]QYH54309.1 multidrug efflux MFS transporter [Liquorilactobacillus nagelii DSM 13675]